MYGDTLDHFAELVAQKSATLRRSPIALGVGAMMAGAYIGIALALALTCAAGLDAGIRPLVMGSVFGIGLVLTIFAGADMFTGYVMYTTIGLARRTIGVGDALALLAFVWICNLLGAALFSWLFALGGGATVFKAPAELLHSYLGAKVGASAVAITAKGILCNWLVCLAIWTSARLKGDAAKVLVVGWTLLAFVAPGFEHSVADMTAVSLGLLFPIPVITFAQAGYDLLWATVGNLIGGGVLVAGAYLAASQEPAPKPASAPLPKPAAAE